MFNPKISLVIINDEAAAYLPQLFKSIEKQNDESLFEVIFIDNCSKDDSVKMAKNFDVHNIYIFNEKTDRRGLLYQKGADLARGEYVIFAHSDIYFKDDFFNNLFLLLEKNKDADFVNFSQHYVDLHFYGNNQIGMNVDTKKLYYKQLFQHSPLPFYRECSEGCFMVKKICLEAFGVSHLYMQSLYEYDLLNKIIFFDCKVLNFAECIFYHYFLEDHDKIQTFAVDEKIFIANHYNLFSLEEYSKYYTHKYSESQNIIVDKENHIQNLEMMLADTRAKYSESQNIIVDKENHTNNLEKILADIQAKRCKLENIIIGKEKNICHLEVQIQNQNDLIINLEKIVNDKERHIANIEPFYLEFKLINKSLLYKFILFHRKMKFLFDSKFRKILLDTKLGYLFLNKHGVKSFFIRLYAYIKGNRKSSLCNNDQYQLFIEKNKFTKRDIIDIQQKCKNFKYKPKISIIVPVFNVNAIWLNKCLQSVMNQYYENWELCLYDDASNKKETIQSLKKWEKKDKRIKIAFGSKNQHISLASNEAIKLASGEFLGLLDNDDEITPDALYEVIKVLNKNKKIDFIYSDEDKLELDGHFSEPYFKPDFNLNLLLSNNYICHFAVIRKSFGDKIKWFRKGYEGSQDYDLFLRIIDKTKNIFHIPKVLYHWRKVPGSTADVYSEKNYADVAAKKALNDYLLRNKIAGSVESGIVPSTFRVKCKIQYNDFVSIIIPFKDRVDLLKTCVESILHKTSYQNYEIILVSNNSKEKQTFNYLKKISKNNKNIKYYEYNVPFNYSKINNWAVNNHANGKYVLLLNNDMEVISNDWLSAMVEHIERKEIGAVGAKLLYPDNTVQHAGVILGIGGIAGHSHKYFNRNEHGYFNRINMIQNLSACTAACLLVKKDLYQKVHGLNEEHLSIAFNDVDLCLKIVTAGYLIVYTPYALLYHYESISRGKEDSYEKKLRFNSECKYMKEKWGSMLQNDPHYNVNLSDQKENFSLKI